MSTVDDLLVDNYIATNHWATTRNGFNSNLNVFNYYGYAFRDCSKEQTDAKMVLHFFEEDGTERDPYSEDLPTGGSCYVAIQEVCPDFQGLVSVQMLPNGRMPRLRHAQGYTRPIATSFFMMYQRTGGFRDFSHELFEAQFTPESQKTEWLTVVYLKPGIASGVIVMNNRPLSEGQGFSSELGVQLIDLDGTPFTPSHQVHLNPGGSHLFMLKDVFSLSQDSSPDAFIVAVRGNNIEQPMSLHLHTSGDFNIHHF